MVKRESRNNLAKNNWGKAVAVTIFVLSISSSVTMLMQLFRLGLNINLEEKTFSLSSYLSDIYINQGVLIESFKNTSSANTIIYYLILLVVLILSFIVLEPLSLGASRFYFYVSKGESPSVEEIFYYFRGKKAFLRSLNFGINALLRGLLWGLVCMLPGTVIMIISGMLSAMPITASSISQYSIALVPISMITLVIGYIFLLAIVLRYFLASYLFISREEIGIKECFKVSFKSMVGYRISVLKLYITFIPWLLLCFFVVPLLYVIPYLQTAKFTCAKWLLVEIEKRDRLNNTNVAVEM